MGDIYVVKRNSGFLYEHTARSGIYECQKAFCESWMPSDMKEKLSAKTIKGMWDSFQENGYSIISLSLKDRYLHNKIKNREEDKWFMDKDGNFYVDTDPHGVQMSGKITIKAIPKNHAHYEVRERSINKSQ